MILNHPVFVAENSAGLMEKIIELIDLPKKNDCLKYFSEDIQ